MPILWQTVILSRSEREILEKHPRVVGRIKLHYAVKHAYDPRHLEDAPSERWDVEELR